MPYRWHPPDVIVSHQGITLWYTYKSAFSDAIRRYRYTYEGDDLEEHSFDIRDLPQWNDDYDMLGYQGHQEVLRQAIEEKTLSMPEGLPS